ncbi:hypothetical protein QCA50_014134 [Cerrena zonata]|uniref:DUF6534 domain-containing protein n=1 Tax=Cerrena zonata TaxID=2478898 RepID=A0AAW0FPH3_9APHY
MSLLTFIPSLIGGFIEGISLSNILFGITLSQFYVYAQNWDRDPKWLKYLATVIILLETGFTVVSQRAQYFYSVFSITNPLLLAEIDWSIPAALILGVITEVTVQGFYMYRMWIFSRNILLLVGMTALLISWDILWIKCIVDTLTAATWITLFEGRNFKLSVTLSVSLVICSDVLIAATMVYLLRRKQSQCIRTRGILGWLVLYFVSTGAALVALAGSVLICFLVSPSTLLWAGMTTLYVRSVSNCFFGALNARQLLRSKQGQVITFGGGFVQDSTTPASVELGQVVRVQVDNNMRSITGSNTTLNSRNHNIKPIGTLNIA